MPTVPLAFAPWSADVVPAPPLKPAPGPVLDTFRAEPSVLPVKTSASPPALSATEMPVFWPSPA